MMGLRELLVHRSLRGDSPPEWEQGEIDMAGMAKAGLTQLVDVVDHTTGAFVVAVDATKDAGAATAKAVINVGDKTLDAALAETETLRQQYIASIRRIADALGDAIPV